jgi:hypothetical protein
MRSQVHRAHLRVPAQDQLNRQHRRGFSRPKCRIRFRSSSEIGRRQRRGRKRKAEQRLRTSSDASRATWGREEQAPRRQSQAQCSQDHSVGWQQLRSLDLPAQNGCTSP